MKLLSHYYRSNIVATLIVVILSSCCYYFLIHYILIQQLDNTLVVEEQEIIDYVKNLKTLPPPSHYKDQQIFYKRAPTNSVVRSFHTIEEYDKEALEFMPTRQLIFTQTVNQLPWHVYVRKSQEQTEDLLKLILWVTAIVVISLLLVLFLINRFVLRRLWNPFHSTLSQLQKFNLSGKNKLALEVTEIDEFNELNNAVSIMTRQVTQEYETLKKFTDNASHEMQTPLAVIYSKLDLLVQDDNVNEQQMGQLQEIYYSLSRLSRISQSLLLLARIENNQFNETEIISLDQAVKDKLNSFEELISNNNLSVQFTDEPVSVSINRYLLDVLLSNLFSNAIRHNKPGGIIIITIKKDKLIISNTSFLKALDPKKIFERFYRHKDSVAEGNGLGLSIVKQISLEAGFEINYYFKDGLHNFELNF